MNRKRSLTHRIAGVLAAPLAVAPALASTSEPWQKHDQAVLKTCTAASGLKAAQALGKPASFSDGASYTALLVQGRHPAPI
ncbi:hypothetical protein [Ottowia testudinis]|uniref:Uncharacterized protein n=1 Tax=Ottowia testudinis TaxID=2816950 RepID=A0A975H4H3_9BURK|nr:hypothetical protein [Ottowia testudinis]QTD46321.1 hypothetical protein J1M35_05350 [Ottowia testudinis]